MKTINTPITEARRDYYCTRTGYDPLMLGGGLVHRVVYQYYDLARTTVTACKQYFYAPTVYPDGSVTCLACLAADSR